VLTEHVWSVGMNKRFFGKYKKKVFHKNNYDYTKENIHTQRKRDEQKVVTRQLYTSLASVNNSKVLALERL
jgi:hypothetical protein